MTGNENEENYGKNLWQDWVRSIQDRKMSAETSWIGWEK